MSQWQLAFNSIYKTTSCAALWQMTQKIAQRWYLTHSGIDIYNRETTFKCWRGCEQEGTLILWDCPYITKFWSDVFLTIANITGLSNSQIPDLAILTLAIDRIPSARQ